MNYKWSNEANLLNKIDQKINEQKYVVLSGEYDEEDVDKFLRHYCRPFHKKERNLK